jgi:hypothetical protein
VSASARLLPIGLAALTAAALGSVTSVSAAFDKVEPLPPIQAGRGYVYYLHEVDAQKQPVAGRTVVVKVGTVPGPGASVAASDAEGHLAGPAGPTAKASSGADGLVHFVLRISTTPGVNEYIWDDGNHQGQVLITGLAGAQASPGAGSGAGAVRGAAAGGTSAPGGPTAAQLARRLPARRVPPLAAGLAGAALCWVLLPGLLARRRDRRLLRISSLPPWSAAAPPR